MSSLIKNTVGDNNNSSFDSIQNHIESLSSKMDKLINIQEKVLNRLDGMSQEIDDIEKDMETLKVDKEEIHVPPKAVSQNQVMGRELRQMCKEMSSVMSTVNQRSEQQAQKLEGVEKLVLSMQQVISFIAETVKSSQVMELMFKAPAAEKSQSSKAKDNKGKLTIKSKSSSDIMTRKVDKKTTSNKATKRSQEMTPACEPSTAEPSHKIKLHGPKHFLASRKCGRFLKDHRSKDGTEKPSLSFTGLKTEKMIPHDTAGAEIDISRKNRRCTFSPLEAEQDQKPEEEEEKKKEETEEEEQEEENNLESEGWAIFKAAGVEFQLDLKARIERARQEKDTENEEEEEDDEDEVERYFIDKTPPPSAPFNHRVVSAKPHQISNFYTISWQEVLGGGRFGQVHKCVENSSGLTLAAKVIKARTQKEKEIVKNEIQVMNHLDHSTLIQLYAAYESRNDIILVLEHVGGGELFDRIIDENYTLMELDAVVFIRQICEGLQHMHRMYILHLDLKPENILCVNRVTNKVKIIDFGLARIYKPREKLKVNFGTPEFLAPEIVNYDFVSFNTDMWSLGVITYMLLSSLCPFLGDNDGETLNNILACRWSFEEQEFEDTSAEAKDFISKVLIMNKIWRMGASEALRHPWLSDPVLHHRLYTKKNMCRSRRSSCVPLSD
ncbi:uncharacterized protein mylk4a [Genypterus blacodes]|uniref:uncharacterized protein mylk4a n=1 Tax=Genypterus blacodes TaxID=154954 RepID=UPI003F7620AD